MPVLLQTRLSTTVLQNTVTQPCFMSSWSRPTVVLPIAQASVHETYLAWIEPLIDYILAAERTTGRGHLSECS